MTYDTSIFSSRRAAVLAIESGSEYLQLALSRGANGDFEKARRKGQVEPASQIPILTMVINRGLKHAELLMPSIRQLFESAEMKMSELDAVVVGRGPGSFTGLRIGMAAAKGLAAALNIPLASVPSLEAMAYAYRMLPEPVVPILDARKQRFYCAAFIHGARILEDSDLAPVDIASLLPKLHKSRRVYMCGPHGSGLMSVLPESPEHMANKSREITSSEVIDLGFSEWASSLLELGAIKLAAGDADTDDSGPEYLRVSEAELGITRKS